jgi:hypothetical protein
MFITSWILALTSVPNQCSHESKTENMDSNSTVNEEALIAHHATRPKKSTPAHLTKADGFS